MKAPSVKHLLASFPKDLDASKAQLVRDLCGVADQPQKLRTLIQDDWEAFVEWLHVREEKDYEEWRLAFPSFPWDDYHNFYDCLLEERYAPLVERYQRDRANYVCPRFECYGCWSDHLNGGEDYDSWRRAFPDLKWEDGDE